MTPQSRRKATPDEDIDLECIPETELKGASDMVSADVASRPLMRQPVFGTPTHLFSLRYIWRLLKRQM